MKPLSSILRKLSKVSAVLLGLCGAGYVMFGNPVFGYRVCTFQGKIMDKNDMAEQGITMLPSLEGLSDIKRETINHMIDGYRQCVRNASIEACKYLNSEYKGTKMTLKMHLFETPRSQSFFSYKGTGAYPFEGGTGAMSVVGCWFNGNSAI
jgi:hypothetical protein